MRSFRDYSIRHKLVSVMLLTSATILLLAFVATLSIEMVRMRSRVMRDVHSKAEIIAANTSAALAFNDAAAAQKILAAMHERPSVAAIRILRADGSLFVEYKRDGTTFTSPPSNLLVDGYSKFEGATAVYCHEIQFLGGPIGIVEVHGDLSEYQQSFKTYVVVMMAVLLVSLLSALPISRRLQRLITDPLEALTFVAQNVSRQKDYSLRAAKMSRDEIGELTDEFNEMLDQVQHHQDELRIKEERFRQIAENVNEVIWMSDPDKNEFIYISPGYERVWGRSCASLYAQPQDWVQAIHPEDRERVLVAAKQKQKNGDYDEEYRIRRPDGAIRWIRDRAFPVRDAQGEVYRIAGLAEDVTEQRRLENEILDISEREQARIGQDLHDGLCQHLVRTALACNLLERDLAAKDCLEASSAHKVLVLIQEAISQARAVSRGLYPVKLEAEGLASALKEMAIDLSHHEGVRFMVECDSSVVVTNHVLAVHLYRIAQEAVNNALKHAFPHQIIVQLESDDDRILLRISDDGVGINDSLQQSQGMGRHIMAYRAHLIGGRLGIKNRQPNGTFVTCTVSENKGAKYPYESKN